MRSKSPWVLAGVLLACVAWVIGGPFIALHAVPVAFQTVGIVQVIVTMIAMIWWLLAFGAQRHHPEHTLNPLTWSFLFLFAVGCLFYGLSVYEYHPGDPRVYQSILQMWGTSVVASRTIFVWSMYIMVLSGAGGCVSAIVDLYRDWRLYKRSSAAV